MMFNLILLNNFGEWRLVLVGLINVIGKIGLGVILSFWWLLILSLWIGGRFYLIRLFV